MRWTRVVLFLRYQPENERRPPKPYLALMAGVPTEKRKSEMAHLALPNYSAGGFADLTKTKSKGKRAAKAA